ncbi:MAG: hypothetical protein KJ070_24010, partial [Verrucomicrobia bacterium]|nr:hypothetical protein [Verrucomicrobiota bacterium]
VGGVVYTLAVTDNDLYVGGAFTNAGQVDAGNIARWDGVNWSALGHGLGLSGPPVGAEVRALAVSGSQLYVGGFFTTAGAVSATCIARWDGQNWFAVGPGLNGTVRALCVVGDQLYAGGSFTSAGAVTVNRVARWDGHNWHPLGTGADNRVHALAWSGNGLYAGGEFREIGGTAANYIARWDGIHWTPLGSGLNDKVHALVVVGGDVCAGGLFSSAGGRQSFHFGSWHEPVIPALTIASLPAPGGVSILWPSSSAGWVLQETADGINSANWSNVTAGIQDDGSSRTLHIQQPTGNRFYRLNKP